MEKFVALLFSPPVKDLSNDSAHKHKFIHISFSYLNLIPSLTIFVEQSSYFAILTPKKTLAYYKPYVFFFSPWSFLYCALFSQLNEFSSNLVWCFVRKHISNFSPFIAMNKLLWYLKQTLAILFCPLRLLELLVYLTFKLKYSFYKLEWMSVKFIAYWSAKFG